MKNATLVQEALTKAFPEAHIQVTDPRGDDQHLAVTVEAEAFVGKTRVLCHQMIYTALGDLMKTRLHALTIVTKTPTQKVLG